VLVEGAMFAFLARLLLVARSRLKSRASLEAENLVLRQQVIVLSRKSRSRVQLRNIDRLIFVWLYRFFPAILNAITVVKPETVIRWHRCGFRAYWRWKSRRRGGRPKIDREIRDLIRRMSKENPLWGAPRIHGELLMLGIEVAQSTEARHMTKRHGPPSQSWKTFLQNHAAEISSIDLFVVRTISFKLLYGLVILRHARRRLATVSVTSNPTAEWIAGQVTDAFPWDEAPPHRFATATAHSARLTPAAFVQWGSEITPLRRGRRGRTATSSGSSDRSVANLSKPPHRARRGALARCPEGLRFVLQ
jgi:hypothetical protein